MNNFDESKHPRDDDGQFAKKEQGGAGGTGTEPKTSTTDFEKKAEVEKNNKSISLKNPSIKAHDSNNSSTKKDRSNKIKNAQKGTELHALTHNYKKTLERYSTWPDGTYDLETGKSISHDTGFQVSFQQTSDDYTQEEYNEIVCDLADTTESMPHVGVFKKDPEISFHCSDKEKVMKIMKEYNQHSAVVWERLQEWNSNPEIQKKYRFDKYCLLLNFHYDPSKNEINRKEKKK